MAAKRKKEKIIVTQDLQIAFAINFGRKSQIKSLFLNYTFNINPVTDVGLILDGTVNRRPFPQTPSWDENVIRWSQPGNNRPQHIKKLKLDARTFLTFGGISSANFCNVLFVQKFR